MTPNAIYNREVLLRKEEQTPAVLQELKELECREDIMHYMIYGTGSDEFWENVSYDTLLDIGFDRVCELVLEQIKECEGAALIYAENYITHEKDVRLIQWADGTLNHV